MLFVFPCIAKPLEKDEQILATVWDMLHSHFNDFKPLNHALKFARSLKQNEALSCLPLPSL